MTEHTELTRPTAEQLAEFARDYLDQHPDAITQDVERAIRDDGHWFAQTFQVQDALEKVRPIKTLTTVEAAQESMRQLADRFEWVSVFWDKGWGDSPLDIAIIVDGDGQAPVARITRGVYQELLDKGHIQENSLSTYKARKLHDYQP